MSYVIQNFYDYNKKITLTPRFKLLLILNNLEKFLIFIKLNTFLYFTNKFNYLHFNYFFFFFKHFFAKKYLKLIINANLTLVSNYTNNLIKSLIFNIFFFLINNFKYINISIKKFNIKTLFLLNLYFYSIKVINININKTFYKNIFFFFLLTNSFIWYQYSSNLKFYLNFIFINYSLKIFRFYNNYFLRIYNY